MENPYLCAMRLPEKIIRFFDNLRTNRVFRVVTNKFVLVTVAALVIFIVDRNGIVTLLQNRQETARQREAIRQYKQKISEVESRIKSLSSDRDSIETFAREEYYYHRDDEDVFIVE